jgi:hypothetical protein
MGLAEKRAVADYQSKEFPPVKDEIQKVLGYPLELDVMWDTMMEPGKSDMYPMLFTKVYFTPLKDALKAIAADEMGKGALKDALKKVVINGASGSHPRDFTFKEGVLTINHMPFSNVDDVNERTQGIKKLLESGL